MYGRNKKYIFLGIVLVIVILIVIFFLMNNTGKTKTISSEKINITKKEGQMKNEVILTVDAGNDVLYYSFDGGITWSTSNTYTVSENKELKIVLKDKNNKIIGEKDYSVVVVNNPGPTITLNDFPETIYVGDTIDLSQYATAKDYQGNILDVTYDPSTIDTSSPKTVSIKYKAVDKDGIPATVAVELSVIEKPSNNDNNNNNNNNNNHNTKKQTYYSYRTKSVIEYDCNYYQCDYVDYSNPVNPTYAFGKDSYCCTGEGCTKENPRMDTCELCVPQPGIICMMCHETFTVKYKAQGNTCYDQKPLTLKNNDGGITYYETPKTECESGEIKVGSYCHKIDSTATTTCPNEYILKDGKCYKQVKKTCANKCTSEKWSSWSKWQTTKVVPSENTQVRTKEM